MTPAIPKQMAEAGVTFNGTDWRDGAGHRVVHAFAFGPPPGGTDIDRAWFRLASKLDRINDPIERRRQAVALAHGLLCHYTDDCAIVVHEGIHREEYGTDGARESRE